MQFYVYIIEKGHRRKNGQGALALPLCKKEWELVKRLLLEIFSEWLWHNGS
jgi:hypothetical protein